jgi:hypothetical protein
VGGYILSYNNAVLADSPLAYWKCNEASGLLQDSSGNGYHFTSGSGLSYSQGILAPQLGQSVALPNTTIRMQRGTVGDWRPGIAVTLEAWVHPTGSVAGSSGFYWFNLWNASQSRSFMWYMHTDGSCGMNSANESGNLQGGCGATLPSPFPIHVVIAVGTDNVAAFYRNGVFVANSTWTNRRNSNTGTLTLGRPPDTFWGQGVGRVSNIAIYQQKLSAARVQAHYAAAYGSSIKVWNGTSWGLKPLKRWDGSAWVSTQLKRWNGTAWV